VPKQVLVDEDLFLAAIRALLKAKPEPIGDIPRKRDPEAKKPGPKKKG
jgi:hypothetical protein